MPPTTSTTPAPTPGVADRWSRVAARAGDTAMLGGGAVCILIGVAASLGLLRSLPDPLGTVTAFVAPLAVLVFWFGLAAAYLPRPGAPPPARAVRSPVRGRWSALNGPATKVPSHGLHAFGQTYAIDLVAEPAPGVRPTFGGPQAMRAPSDYPAFGQPVYAPAAARVVAVHDRRRDHRARSNLLGFLYMMVEGMVMQLRGPAGIMGNHVILELDDGTAVALAHLQQGSSKVREGDQVQEGEVIAAVGNSGNSSEPHLHLQLMDHVRPSRAAGVPFVFTDVVVADDLQPPAAEPDPVVPEDEAVFHAGIA